MKAIIILFDTLNKRYLPPYGNKDVIAPNFERLSKSSCTFDNSYIGSMPCMPARRELHTGRYNFLHREWGPLEPFDDSMPEILKNNGIYTHLISDHFHYWEDGGATYHNRYSSWEAVRGQEGDPWKGKVSEPEIPEVLTIPKKHSGKGITSLWRQEWVNREYIRNESDFPQTKVFDLGCKFLEENANEDNWLLQIESFDPHEPFYVPEHYLKMYDDDYDGPYFDWPRGEVKESREAVEHIRKRYSALITMCDKNLGRILDLMDKHRLWEDTMLFVGTDHGFLLGEHGYWGKNLMPYYNEIANTPLFIWDPRSKKKGVRRKSLVQMIDWAPTLLDYFNIKIPEDMEGKVLQKTIKDDSPVRDACLYGVFSGHVNITDGQYTYMKCPKPENKNLLFNYTLMPTYMKKRFSTEELSNAELVEPFKFTKGCKVLKVPAKDKYGVYKFGDLLFELNNDTVHAKQISDENIKQKLEQRLIELMEENDAPAEQYKRLGLRG